MPFDGIPYTREQTAIDLLGIEEHSTNGSALKANCACIQERHILSLKGHCQEGAAITTDPQEKQFYRDLHVWASENLEFIYETLKRDNFEEQKAMYARLGNESREIRVNLQDERWIMPHFHCGCVGCLPCSNHG